MTDQESSIQEMQETSLEVEEVQNLKIFGVKASAIELFRDYAKKRTRGKFNIAFEQLLRDAEFLSFFSIILEKIENLELRLEELERQSNLTIPTMGGHKLVKREVKKNG